MAYKYVYSPQFINIKKRQITINSYSSVSFISDNSVNNSFSFIFSTYVMVSRLSRSDISHTFIRGRSYCTWALQHSAWCKAQRYSWGRKNNSVNKTISWSPQKCSLNRDRDYPEIRMKKMIECNFCYVIYTYIATISNIIVIYTYIVYFINFYNCLYKW